MKGATVRKWCYSGVAEALRPKVRYALAGLLVALLIPVAAGAKTTTNSARAADSVTFLTDFGLYGGNAGPLYVGIQRGIFQKYGINLNVVSGVGSTDTAQKIGAGTAQFGYVDGVAGVLAKSNGANIEYIGAYLQSHVGGLCYVKSRHPIASYKDAEGIHIGATAGDAYMVFLPYLMKTNHADPNYHYDTLAAANLGSALLGGQVDAISCGAITLPSRIAAAQAVGEQVGFFPYGKHGLNALGLMLAVNGDLASSNPGLVLRFEKAYAASLQWSRAHPQEVAQDFPTAQTAQSPDTVEMSWQLTEPFQLAKKKSLLLSMPTQKMKSTVGLTIGGYKLNQTRKSLYAMFNYSFVKKLPASLRKP